MTDYNPAVAKLEMPARIARLPIDKRGYPVPRFVSWINGEPDFRVVRGDWVATCYKQELCWVCGEKRGAYLAFVIGPMCCINKITSEPPQHLECAQFSVRVCPFMLHPQRGRNDANLPDGHELPAGILIDRNPGVSLIYVTRSYKPVRPPVGKPGVLFALGDPTSVEWWSHGRKATHDEIMRSIESGLPALREMAEQQGSSAVEELNRQIKIGLTLVPA